MIVRGIPTAAKRIQNICPSAVAGKVVPLPMIVTMIKEVTKEFPNVQRKP